jgi:hypothetical protein
MGQITINTDSIVRVGIAIILILAIVGLGISIYNLGKSSVEVSSAQPVAAPTYQTTIPTYPSVVTFTVLSTTTSTGRYQVLTTVGQILICPDYYTWNTIRPQNTYTADVVGTEGNMYLVKNIYLIANHQSQYYQSYYSDYHGDYYYHGDYPYYYRWNGKYYQWDGYTLDEITWKQAQGEYIRNEQPPHYFIHEYY